MLQVIQVNISGKSFRGTLNEVVKQSDEYLLGAKSRQTMQTVFVVLNNLCEESCPWIIVEDVWST